MATGIGFCPNCGTAMSVAGQQFCASCGATLPSLAATAVPTPVPTQAPSPYQYSAPALAPMPVAPPPPYGAPAPPPWGVPVAPLAAAPARTGTNPALFLVGALVIVAIVVVAGIAMNNGSKGLPGTSGSPASGSPIATVLPSPSTGSAGAFPGSLTFNPSTIGCPSQPFTTTVVLPASFKATDQITYKIDDKVITTLAVSDFGLTQQADGTWLLSQDNPDGSSNCSMGPGVHTARLLDATGKVLAQTSFTFVTTVGPPTNTPQPLPTTAPGAGTSVTITPSTISCSAADAEISLSISLDASFDGSTQITSEVDGVAGNTSSVSDGFEQQLDGSWLSSATASSASLCEQLSIGQHRLGALDKDGKIITEGKFTLKP